MISTSPSYGLILGTRDTHDGGDEINTQSCVFLRLAGRMLD